jgi:hypothetical protein
MAELVKIVGEEITLSAANDVATATVVRIYNNNAGAVLITRRDEDTNILGTMTTAPGEVLYLVKTATDTLSTNTGSVLATPTAYL